jgi:uncharacterized membrane protein
MGKDIFMYSFALILVGCVIGIVCLLVYVPIPKENHDAFMLIIGTLLGWGGATVTYYYGSSKSSAEKTELLKEKES